MSAIPCAVNVRECDHPNVDVVESYGGAALAGQCRGCLKVIRVCPRCRKRGRFGDACVPTSCAGCDGEVVYFHDGRPPKFCNEKCRRRTARRRRRGSK